MDLHRQAVLLSLLFCAWLWVWSMNDFDRGPQLKLPQPAFPPFTVGGLFASRCQKSALPSQSGNLIFVWKCVRMNKTIFFFFFCLNIKASHSSHLSKANTSVTNTPRDEADLKNQKKKWNELKRGFLLVVCLHRTLYSDQLTVSRLL